MHGMQCHVDTIQRKVLSDDIGHHINSDGHRGKQDLELYVFDFIFCHPKTEFAKSLQLLFKNKWIHKLRTQLPNGLNTIHSIWDYGKSRNW